MFTGSLGSLFHLWRPKVSVDQIAGDQIVGVVGCILTNSTFRDAIWVSRNAALGCDLPPETSLVLM